MNEPTQSRSGTTVTVAAPVIEAELAALSDAPALIIPLADLPAGTQIVLTIVVGPPAPPEPSETPPPAGPRFLGGRR